MNKVAEAASGSSHVGQEIERAMSDAVAAAHEEAAAIFARKNLSDEEKQKKAAEIRDPAEIRRRMLAARDRVLKG